MGFKLLILGFRNFEIWEEVEHKEIPKSQNPETSNYCLTSGGC
jgi:hypothetical protein